MSLWARMLGGWYEYAIEELRELVRACPDSLWEAQLWQVKPTDRIVGAGGVEPAQTFATFWFVAYHAARAMDGYLTPLVPFTPPKRFDVAEDGGVADRVLGRDELLAYFDYCSEKSRTTFERLTDEAAAMFRTDEPFASSLIRGLMHTREHTGQLGLFLGARGVEVGGSAAV